MTLRHKAILSLLSAFIIGFACCYLLFYFDVLRHPPLPQRHEQDRTNAMVTLFTKELNLDAKQQEFLKQELEKIRIKHNEIRQNNAKQFRQLRDDFRQSFSQVLTEEQKRKFDEFNRKRDEKFKR